MASGELAGVQRYCCPHLHQMVKPCPLQRISHLQTHTLQKHIHTAGCGPFLYQPPGFRRARSDAGAARLNRRSASPPRTARGLAYQLGYGAGTAAREVHERLYFNANEMRARKEAQQRLRCAPRSQASVQLHRRATQSAMRR